MSFSKVNDMFVTLLHEILTDVPKAMKGNKTAAQRIRTRTVTFAKVSKEWRKLSLQQEKKKNVKKSSTSRKSKAS